MLTEFDTSQKGGERPQIPPRMGGIEPGFPYLPLGGYLESFPVERRAEGGTHISARPAAAPPSTDPARLVELVTRWSPLVDLWLNGEFRPKGDRWKGNRFRRTGPPERHLYDETMVTRHHIIRSVLGWSAVHKGWAESVVDAVMNVPAWKRITTRRDTRYGVGAIGYRLRCSTLAHGEELTPL